MPPGPQPNLRPRPATDREPSSTAILRNPENVGGAKNVVSVKHSTTDFDSASAPSFSFKDKSASDAQGVALVNRASEATSQALNTLSTQLELERNRVNKLKKYEKGYKEWRVRADQLAQDLRYMEEQLCEKDTELSGAYRKLETSATERLALRQSNLNLKDETVRIRGLLEEAKARYPNALTDGSKGRSSGVEEGDGNENGSGGEGEGGRKNRNGNGSEGEGGRKNGKGTPDSSSMHNMADLFGPNWGLFPSAPHDD
eukprot:gene7126-231_t